MRLVKVSSLTSEVYIFRLREVCRVLQETQQRVIKQKDELDALLHMDAAYRDSVCWALCPRTANPVPFFLSPLSSPPSSTVPSFITYCMLRAISFICSSRIVNVSVKHFTAKYELLFSNVNRSVDTVRVCCHLLPWSVDSLSAALFYLSLKIIARRLSHKCRGHLYLKSKMKKDL